MGSEPGVTVSVSNIGRIGIIIRCRVQSKTFARCIPSSRRPLAVRLMRLRRVETVPAQKTHGTDPEFASRGR